jgi:SAM-dependent methyltransferase
MNHQERFLAIHDFLLAYQRIWQNEIMLLYPHPLDDYPTDWVAELASFRQKEDLIRIEKKDVFDYIKNPGLIEFYQKIEALSDLPLLPHYPPMPEDQFTYLFMIPKKQYEIKRLSPMINQFCDEHEIESIIDIGGGVGLLAQTLTNQYNLKVTSVDMDPVMQKTGEERNRKNAKNPDNLIDFVPIKVDANENAFNRLLTPSRMTLGLHTCGNLANDQIRASVKNKVRGIINFGCCYHKLEDAEDAENISALASLLEDKIEMSHFALTLAARAHRKMDEKDYDLKLKVKLYRYAIHFLLHDEYGFKKLVTLGNSSPKLYDESFGVYVLEQFRRINLKARHSVEELNDYFTDPARQEFIWKMLAAGIIRNALGRLLELYILLDRAIYLEENLYRVELLEFFDEGLSPRNIGIVAHWK